MIFYTPIYMQNSSLFYGELMFTHKIRQLAAIYIFCYSLFLPFLRFRIAWIPKVCHILLLSFIWNLEYEYVPYNLEQARSFYIYATSGLRDSRRAQYYIALKTFNLSLGKWNLLSESWDGNTVRIV